MLALRKGIRQVALVLVMVGALQGVALAESVEGRVAQVNSRELGIVVYDAQGRPYPNTLILQLHRDTRFDGIRSAMDLRANDPIGAEIFQEESGAWRADYVTLFQEVNARPATQKPSPSLRDALGNPVVRGALLGAASGAIASSASGGKAGKGALVGAGVGAAAGLLEGLFSGQPRQSSDTDR